MKDVDVTKNICIYMNGMSSRVFNRFEVSAIRDSLKIELQDRKNNHVSIASYTKDGKWKIYKRVAQIANKKYKTNLTADDVRIYKICNRQEYEDRTHKCCWSIARARELRGFDPVTGYELEIM